MEKRGVQLLRALAILLLLFHGRHLGGQTAVPTPTPTPTAIQAAANLNIKYVRDSAEYSTLTRQVYRVAGNAVVDAAKAAPSGGWAVVLDVDETSLDNSVYELERAAYGVPFGAPSWNAWVKRRQASAVPGAAEFIKTVRGISGSRVVWMTDRDIALIDATRANLASAQLWDAADLLCMRNASRKKQRRQELAAGKGACSWPGTAIQVLAFVGDQMGDFPDPDEPNWANDAFGVRFFLLPNPMYGSWVGNVTRPE